MIVEFPWWIYPVLVWTVIWKGLALWRAAKNNHGGWFVLLLVVNTVGLLPITYLYWFQRDGKKARKKKKISGKRKFPTLS